MARKYTRAQTTEEQAPEEQARQLHPRTRAELERGAQVQRQYEQKLAPK